MNSSTALALPASLQTAVREAVAASTADNTERAYRSDAAVFVAFAEKQGLCPMPAAPATVAAFLAAEALRAWMSRAGIGYAGRSPHPQKPRNGCTGLKHGAKVSGHSLRVGMAQDLAGANTDLAGIMQAGSWKSVAMVARYTERVAAKRGAIARFYANRQGI